jgi:cytoskeleton protein RodZ
LVGEILRKKREESGLDLRAISKTLKISHAYLKAIEDGAFEKLPEEVYIKGYIREYAELLKVDPETAINAYIQQVSPPKTENKEVPEKETAQGKKLNVRYFLFPLILAVLVITSIYILFPYSSDKKGISQTPEETEKETLNNPVETEEENPAPAAEAKNELVTSTAESGIDNVSKTEKSPHVLEVFAKDTTWLFLTIDKSNGKEMMLKPGESEKWEAENGFSLKIGNAGGIKLIFDGKEIGKLGEKGQVVNLNLP